MLQQVPPRWLEVWVDHPHLGGCFTYRVPAEWDPQPGDLLSVPFGEQMAGAVVLAWRSDLPEGVDPQSIRDIEAVVAKGILPQEFWPLLQRVADYYLTPLAQVVRTILPPGLLNRSQRRIRLLAPTNRDPGSCSAAAQKLLQILRSRGGDLSWRYLQQQVPNATAALRELQQQGWVESRWQEQRGGKPKTQQAASLADPSPEGLSPPQQQALHCLQRAGGELLLTDWAAKAGVSRAVLQGLARKGRVHLYERPLMRLGEAASPCPWDQPKPLTAAQTQAVQPILKALGQAQRFLLHGVTGSGKTEVYLQVIAQVLQRGESALVLVPEIGLTPQLTDRFRARLGSRVWVYHSGLSEGERYDTWRQMLSPGPQVVIGTRSAVFAPLAPLGLILLDEEHDDSFKQEQPQPCYHARRVAEWRAELAGCPLVLGSATPAVETYAAHLRAPQQWIRLPLAERIPQQGIPVTLPQLELVDMRQELAAGNRTVLSRRLQQALEQTLDKGEQAILFVPRRGYSTFVLCRSCGFVLTCEHCDVSLTFHLVGQDLRCHYCGARHPHPQQCPNCGSPYLKHFGSGTQKVVEALQQHWPHLSILRYDSDATRRKGSHRDLLEQFRRGEAQVLVGTQMLTKGLDIPQVTLVGVVAADGLLHQSDYRAGERSFQLLTQVAGRAGRGSLPGQAMIQTYLPEHPILAAVLAQDYEGFLRAELKQRQEGGYPPYRSLILMRLSSTRLEPLERYCTQVAERLQGIPGEVLGPGPAQVERVSGRYRWQILLKQDPDRDPRQLAPQLHKAIGHPPQGIRVSLDVDPLRIL
ncbi:MAG: primosomal protein N' [Thermostichus sp. DG02_5_bins_236]